MSKFLIFIFLLIGSGILFAQNITLGDQATLWIGNQASFYFGGNTTLNGTLTVDKTPTTSGTIVSFSDIDFVTNRTLGNLKFVGDSDQNLLGDTLDVVDIEVDKTGNSNVILMTNRVVVSGTLNLINGVIQAEDELDLLVSGGSGNSGQGYVEGKLVGLTAGQPVTFPMGVNGFPNYITLTNTDPGVIIRVECRVPDGTTLLLDEETIGISDEVEWLITSIGDSTNAEITIDFSGVDLSDQGFVNFNNIAATSKHPAIVVYSEDDTVYHALSGTPQDLDAVDPRPPTSGTVVSTDPIKISEDVTKIAVGWIPIVDGIEFFIPNSFAPNGTQPENRVFRPFFAGEDVVSVSVSVYNSLNTEVYSISLSGQDLDLSTIGWDGVLPSGQDAQGGVYYYNVKLVGTTFNQTVAGAVYLVR